MGASCSHTRLTPTNTIQDGKTLFTNKKIVIYECQDCGGTIAKELRVGRVTNATYSSKEINRYNCEHKYFDVDESSVQNKSEQTLGGILTGMLTAKWYEPRQHYSEGVAKCQVCAAKFRVRSDFNVDRYWDNKVQKEREVHEEWKICKKNVPSGTTKEEIEYVS